MYVPRKQEVEQRTARFGGKELPAVRNASGRTQMKKTLVRIAAVLALSLPVSTLPAQAIELKIAD